MSSSPWLIPDEIRSLPKILYQQIIFFYQEDYPKIGPSKMTLRYPKSFDQRNYQVFRIEIDTEWEFRYLDEVIPVYRGLIFFHHAKILQVYFDPFRKTHNVWLSNPRRILKIGQVRRLR